MRLKLDDAGHVVVNDGMPVYVGADGREVTFDAAATIARAEKAEASAMVVGAIARSPFVADRLAIPADIVAAHFGSAFRIEAGALVAYDADGNKLYSRQRPGEVADVEEALAMLVDRYPDRDRIVKRPAGTASTPDSSGNTKGGSLRRTAFESLPPAERMAHIKAGGTITD